MSCKKRNDKKYPWPIQIAVGYIDNGAIAIDNSNASDNPSDSAVAQGYSNASDNPTNNAVAQKRVMLQITLQTAQLHLASEMMLTTTNI